MALDMEQINLLDNQQKQKYMALERLFTTPGWKFVKDFCAASAEEAAAGILRATKWEDHCFALGARNAYLQIGNFEVFAENEFAAHAEDALAKKAEAELDKDDVDIE